MLWVQPDPQRLQSDSETFFLHKVSQGPGQIAEVHRASEACVRLQQAHDDGHGCLVVTGAAGAGLVHDVDAQVRVITFRERESVKDVLYSQIGQPRAGKKKQDKKHKRHMFEIGANETCRGEE